MISDISWCSYFWYDVIVTQSLMGGGGGGALFIIHAPVNNVRGITVTAWSII